MRWKGSAPSARPKHPTHRPAPEGCRQQLTHHPQNTSPHSRSSHIQPPTLPTPPSLHLRLARSDPPTPALSPLASFGLTSWLARMAQADRPAELALNSTAGSTGGPRSARRASSAESFETSLTSQTGLTVVACGEGVENGGAPVLDSPELGRGIMSGDWGFARQGMYNNNSGWRGQRTCMGMRTAQ